MHYKAIDAQHPHQPLISPEPDDSCGLSAPFSGAGFSGAGHGVAADRHAIGAMQEILTTLAAGLDARFVQAGTLMSEAIETIDRVIATIGAVTGALDEDEAGASARNLGVVADLLSQLPAVQAERKSDLAAIESSAAVLHADALKIQEALFVLRIYGMNIKIAASGNSVFVQLVDDIFGRLAVGEREILRLAESVKKLLDSSSAAAKAEEMLAIESRSIIPQVPNKLVSDAAELRKHQNKIADIAAKVRTTALTIQGKVAMVIGALQIGDITRQRLEHVCAGLQCLTALLSQQDLNPTAAQTVQNHILRLLAAQLTETATDFQRDARLLAEALGGIAPDAAALLGLSEACASHGNGTSFLHQLESGITEIGLVTQKLRAAHDQAEKVGTVISDTVDELQARLCSVRDLSADVQHISVNTRLRSREMGAIGRAVGVIAIEVCSQANHLDGAANSIARVIGDLGDLNHSMRSRHQNATKDDASEILSASLSSIRDACRRTDSNIEAIDIDTKQAIEMLRSASQKVARDLDVEEMFNTVLVTLAALEQPAMNPEEATEEAQQVIAQLLDQIAPLYTMAQERVIHQKFILPGMAADPVITVSPDASDDDFLEDAFF